MIDLLRPGELDALDALNELNLDVMIIEELGDFVLQKVFGRRAPPRR